MDAFKSLNAAPRSPSKKPKAPAKTDFRCRPGAEVNYEALAAEVKADFPKILSRLAE
jgi:hypothetical protein